MKFFVFCCTTNRPMLLWKHLNRPTRLCYNSLMPYKTSTIAVLKHQHIYSNNVNKIMRHAFQRHFLSEREKQAYIFNNYISEKRFFFTSQYHLKKKGFNPQHRKTPTGSASAEEFNIDDLADPEFNALLTQASGSLLGLSSIAVIQPWVKWGPEKRTETSPQLLLDEACSLIKSLPFLNVTFQEHVSLQQISKSHVFGSGTLERLFIDIQKTQSQAVFISVHHLTRVQKSVLEEHFKMRVFDRYFIVLSIFKHHASTTEARLQIAMAELPLMSKAHLNEKDRLVLHEREAKLKTSLKRLAERRGRIRATREKSSLPSVAVVGYTNCGKTTLIRALTGDEKIQGENRLFATLDVSAHKAFLPCGLGVVLIDSVGFIQDIPTKLIASFNATLQDAIYSDVVVLVRDVSHPDLLGQTNTVRQTLASLPLPEDTPIVVVNNKADLLQEDMRNNAPQDGFFASSITGEGLSRVLSKIQSEVLRVTERKMYRMKLPTGSPEIEWLKNSVGVSSEEVCKDDPQFTQLTCVLNEAEKAAFRRAFR